MASLATQTARILIADPASEHRLLLVDALCADGMSCAEAADGIRAWTCFRTWKPDLVIASLRLPGLDGLGLLARVREASDVPVFIQIPPGDLRAAVEATKRGAAEVIPFPCEINDLTRRIRVTISATTRASDNNPDRLSYSGRSSDASRIRGRIGALAPLRVPVLFRGEKGSGRSHAARCLVASSSLDPQHLVRIGAAEGSRRLQNHSRKIVYLEEIEKFPLADQSYWLEVIRASEEGDVKAPRRILASTTCDLDALSRAIEFDPDLAHCLLRFVLVIPALRNRLNDMSILVDHLSRSIAFRIGRGRPTVSAPALKLLQAQPWPGNVAQLEGVIEKLIAFAPDSLITKQSVVSVLAECHGSVASLRQSAVQRQRNELVSVLDETGGNLAETARRLKMSRGAIIYRAQKFGLLSKRGRRA